MLKVSTDRESNQDLLKTTFRLGRDVNAGMHQHCLSVFVVVVLSGCLVTFFNLLVIIANSNPFLIHVYVIKCIFLFVGLFI